MVELLYEAERIVAVAWTRASLSENTFVTAVAVIRAAWPIANKGIEELR